MPQVRAFYYDTAQEFIYFYIYNSDTNKSKNEVGNSKSQTDIVQTAWISPVYTVHVRCNTDVFGMLCPQSASATQTAACLLDAWTRVFVSVKTEPRGGAVTPVYLDTPGEEAGPAAQVHRGAEYDAPHVIDELIGDRWSFTISKRVRQWAFGLSEWRNLRRLPALHLSWKLHR